MVSLSFFDTVIDEILLFDLQGQYLLKKDTVYLASLVDKRSLEDVEIRPSCSDSEIFSFLTGSLEVFMGLDFWDPLDEVSKLCQKPIIFAASQSGNSIDMGIKELKVPSLQELEILVKNSDNTVHFYTKHTKGITNFLEYNNLKAQVKEVSF